MLKNSSLKKISEFTIGTWPLVSKDQISFGLPRSDHGTKIIFWAWSHLTKQAPVFNLNNPFFQCMAFFIRRFIISQYFWSRSLDHSTSCSFYGPKTTIPCMFQSKFWFRRKNTFQWMTREVKGHSTLLNLVMFQLWCQGAESDEKIIYGIQTRSNHHYLFDC